jgi:integrase
MAYRIPNSPYWQVSVTNPHTGERTRHNTKTANKKEAEALEAKWRTEAHRDAFWDDALARPLKLHQAIDDYLTAHSDKRSARQDRIRGATLKRLLPDLSIYRLEGRLVAQYVAARREHVASSTINRELALLSVVLNDAAKQGFPVRNPVRGFKQRERAGREDFLTEEEAQRLIAAAQTSHAEYLADWIQVSLHTGLRFGELRSLRWTDLRGLTLTVQAEQAKSGKRRTLRLSPAILALLEGQPHRGETIFTRNDGTPINDIRTALTHACQRAGLRRITPHIFRHTCASWLVQAGVPLYTVKEWLGHSTISVTERYAHLTPDHLETAAHALESKLSQHPGK